MSLENIFKKNVNRHIDGVIKAMSVEHNLQELDEFVITKEIDLHLAKFVESYNSYADRDLAAASKNGVWISGFFGSGKSHFLKILSYLVENSRLAASALETINGTKTPYDFFSDKITDKLFLSQIKRMTDQSADVILFNIEDKVNTRTDSDSNILEVLLKEFNHKIGLCEAFPEVAEFERQLQRDNIYADFCDKYLTETGENWNTAREKFYFRAPKIAAVYSKIVGGMIDTTILNDMVKKQIQISTDNFCKIVKDYLDSKGKNHRLIYFIDEMGQFVGAKTDRLLQLQTIIESLGSKTYGQAMVVVTSQQAIDEIIDFDTKAQTDAFSKITGRFSTRLSLTSANVDEVIQKRLLDKTPEAVAKLEQVYKSEGDILNSKLLFKDNRTEYPKLASSIDYAKMFPFMPYQIRLIQNTFNGIRKTGIAGAHLAHGERSLLNAFQLALKESINNLTYTSLIPLYAFFPSIQSWLEDNIAATIEQAKGNTALDDNEFDINLLKTLFLVRYIDQFSSNLTNLTVLMLDNIHQDVMELKDRISGSLERLEGQSLISKSGEFYKFLTNEEQDISRQIRAISLAPNDEVHELMQLMVDGVLSEIPNQRRFEYSNQKIFEYDWRVDSQDASKANKACDFKINFITERNEQHQIYLENPLASMIEPNQIVFVLKHGGLGSEFVHYLKTNKFISENPKSNLDSRLQKIIQERQEDNQIRKNKLIKLLKELTIEATCLINGKEIQMTNLDLKGIVNQAINYYIENNYSNLNLIKTPYPMPVEVSIKGLITKGFNDIVGQDNKQSRNPPAYSEMKRYLDTQRLTHMRTSLGALIRDKFGRKPFGWNELQTVAIIGELYANNVVSLLHNNQPISRDNVAGKLFAMREWNDIYLEIRDATPQELLDDASSLYHELFKQTIATNLESEMQEKFATRLNEWHKQISEWISEAGRIDFPLGNEITKSLVWLPQLTNAMDKILVNVVAKQSDLKQLSELIANNKASFSQQIIIWQSLASSLDKFIPEQSFFAKTPDLQNAIVQLNTIKTEHKLDQLPQVRGLISKLKIAYEDELATHKLETIQKIEDAVVKINYELDLVKASPDERNQHLISINKTLRERVNFAINFATLAGIEKNLSSDVSEIINEINTIARKNAEVNNQPQVQLRVIKKINPRQLLSKPYLESITDIEDYINKLRNELMTAIAENNRIEIN